MLAQRVAQPTLTRTPACKPCTAFPARSFPVSRGLFPSHPATPSRGSQAAKRLSTKASMDTKALHSLPGVAQQRDPATDGFVFQQTMYRIRDPKASLDFYTRIMGLTLLNRLDFPEMGFSLYFLGQYPASEVPSDPKDRTEWTFSRPGTLELTHNWGTESDPNFQGYHNGNSDPGRGFGHIGFAVPDVEAACQRFEKEGVAFSKRPQDGKMKGLAFIKDPDNYLIEIFNAQAGRAFA